VRRDVEVSKQDSGASPWTTQKRRLETRTRLRRPQRRRASLKHSDLQEAWNMKDGNHNQLIVVVLKWGKGV
jgi:hypothetical protein